jgi:hypothetical protein
VSSKTVNATLKKDLKLFKRSARRVFDGQGDKERVSEAIVMMIAMAS